MANSVAARAEAAGSIAYTSVDPTYLWKKGDRRETSGADVPAP